MDGDFLYNRESRQLSPHSPVIIHKVLSTMLLCRVGPAMLFGQPSRSVGHAVPLQNYKQSYRLTHSLLLYSPPLLLSVCPPVLARVSVRSFTQPSA